MEEYELTNDNLQTKCSWTPFAGKQLTGKVQRVTLHGKVVYENGNIIAEPGSGTILG